VPEPSHWEPPVEHGLPAATGLLVGTPLSHPSFVHGFWSSTGTQSAPPVPLLLVAVLLLPPPLVVGLGSLLQPAVATTLTPIQTIPAIPKSNFMRRPLSVALLSVKTESTFEAR
jgi:hypothetical protein